MVIGKEMGQLPVADRRQIVGAAITNETSRTSQPPGTTQPLAGGVAGGLDTRPLTKTAETSPATPSRSHPELNRRATRAAAKPFTPAHWKCRQATHQSQRVSMAPGELSRASSVALRAMLPNNGAPERSR
jgi:hypothetical protein